MIEPEKYHPCPLCGNTSLILLDITTDLPMLSPSGTYYYYCPTCGQRVWEGMNNLPLHEREGDRRD